MKFLFVCTIVFFAFKGNMFAEEIFIQSQSSLPEDARELYIDLMKRILANTIYEDSPLIGKFDRDARGNGMDWPSVAHTMVGSKRLDNIHCCLEKIFENDVPGDCIETGVWRGGCAILMRAILKAYNDTERKVWVADSFAGFPQVNEAKYPHDASWSTFAYNHVVVVPIEQVLENFRRYELLDSQVVFVKGFFSETLPNLSIDQIALLRLDGDFYESTMDALTHLYPKLSKGGFVIIDDYGLDSCRVAVTDFRNRFQITDPIIEIDRMGVYWEKTQ